MTSTIHVKPGESERPALLLREYVESVNAWDVDRAFSVLQGAKVTVPHGTNVAETMEGEKVKEWLEHRIVKQRAKVRLTGGIDVDGNTARAELSTSSGSLSLLESPTAIGRLTSGHSPFPLDSIPQDGFPHGIYTHVTLKCDAETGKVTEYKAEPKDVSDWDLLVEMRKRA